jgi:hypothetical protein
MDALRTKRLSIAIQEESEQPQRASRVKQIKALLYKNCLLMKRRKVETTV